MAEVADAEVPVESSGRATEVPAAEPTAHVTAHPTADAATHVAAAEATATTAPVAPAANAVPLARASTRSAISAMGDRRDEFLPASDFIASSGS